MFPNNGGVNIMAFAMGFLEISLLLAIIAIVLLITSEMLSPQYGKVSIFISKRKLKKVTLFISILFLATVAITIFQIMLNL